MKAKLPLFKDLDLSMRSVHELFHDFESLDFLMPTEIDNKMIVREENQTADIAVCIQKEILSKLEGLSYPRDFDLNLLQEWSVIFEEVSHFHHYCHQAVQNKVVSPLELETQAEIDKLYFILDALEQKNESSFEDKVFSLLFDELKLGSWVATEDVPLYEQAHHQARQIGREIFYQAPHFSDKKDLFRQFSLLS